MSNLIEVNIMKGYLKQIVVSVSVVFACLASCAAMYFVPTTIYCEQRKQPPTAPTYPSSTLEDSDFFLVGLDYSLWPPKLDEPGMSLATYYYIVAASPERIIEFYTELDGASIATNGVVFGAAEPFGEYNIGIPNQNEQTGDGITEYFIEIRWEQC
jgi:hypothetical protein